MQGWARGELLCLFISVAAQHSTALVQALRAVLRVEVQCRALPDFDELAQVTLTHTRDVLIEPPAV